MKVLLGLGRVSIELALDVIGSHRKNQVLATAGITGWTPLRDRIDRGTRHLDVGSGYPLAAGGRMVGSFTRENPYVS